MADHHDAQDYTANGPTDTGFLTGGEDITNGVVATGKEIGVHGIGKGTAGSSKPTVGVFGQADEGDGVQGLSQTHSGVFGVSAKGRGVRGSGQTGVEGLGNNIRVDPATGKLIDSIGVHGRSQEGIGVLGESEKVGTVDPTTGKLIDSIGVHGRSQEGIGVLGESVSGVGLRGSSTNNRGGVFRSGKNVAQIRLEPLNQGAEESMLPEDGRVGDLLFIRNTWQVFNPDTQETRDVERSSLWLCIHDKAKSEKSNRWQRIELGKLIIGTAV